MRIVQISDLHFGRDTPELLDPLRTAIQATKPDLVAMAGDFVQRARESQFSEASEFMKSLGLPWIGVPGNHDLPLFNLAQRYLDPYAPYKRWISKERQPMVETKECVVLGIDTTDRWHWQRGHISSRQIAAAAALIAREQGRRTVVIVAHHPFHQRPEVEKKLMIGAPRALKTWAKAGNHVILSGHLHTWLVEPFVTRKGKMHTLQVHSGTGLSNRTRGEPNDFAVLDIDRPEFRVSRRLARDGRFIDAGTDTFREAASGWELVESGIAKDRQAA